MRSSQFFDRAATIWKIFYLLSLIIFTFDFPRDKFTQAEPVRADTVLVSRDDRDYRDTQGRANNTDEISRHVISNDENSSELVSKWRDNDEASESKWREDGDTAALLPVPHFSRYSRDEVDSKEEEEDYSRQGLKYRPDNSRRTNSRWKNDERISHYDYVDYERINSRNIYGEREIFPRRRNNRLSTSQQYTGSTIYKEAKKDVDVRSHESIANKDLPSTRYRDAFQIRPNDYEHELNDEEYLKPRPRKRRPPQNYEFALAANEASLRNQKIEDPSRPSSRSNGRGSLAESHSKNDAQLSQNAVELKSLLKMQQEEGLSLSEILQRRNLTLSDLLRGNIDVISALKSKDINETDDYNETVVKAMSDAFIENSSTEVPRWLSATGKEQLESSDKEETRINLTNNSYVSRRFGEVTSSLSFKDAINRTSLNDIARIKLYPESENTVTGKSMIVTTDRLQNTLTTSASVSTVVTTSAPLLVSTNSMELFETDDAIKLEDNHEIKSDSLDEDEIMEFSDFTDYKKGRTSMSPVWLMVQDKESTISSVDSLMNAHGDKGSTLSIEQILSPTVRTKPINNSSTSKDNKHEMKPVNIKVDKMFINKYQSTIVEQPEEDYGTFLEHEYQDDATMVQHETEHSTNSNSPRDKNDSRSSTMEGTESNADTKSNDNYSFKNHQGTDMNEKRTYEDIMSEIEPEARAEIFELFASGSAGKRLERLLKSRNMSVEELIALRQRGSSKVHLAEVSRFRVQKSNADSYVRTKSNPVPTTSLPLIDNIGELTSESAAEKIDISTVQEHTDNNLSNYPLDVTLCETKSDSEPTMSSINFVHLDETLTKESFPNSAVKDKNEDLSKLNFDITKNEDKGTNENHRAIEIVDLLTTFASLPFAKNIQRDFAGNDVIKKLSLDSTNTTVKLLNTNDSTNIVRSGYVEEIIEEKPNSFDIRTIYSETSSNLSNDENKNEERKAQSKVKPSIIASGAILGVTIVVFLAIFIACRIRQKQKYRYRNTFSRAVFQGPVLAARKLSNSSSLSTVMVNIVATSTTKRPEKNETHENTGDADPKSDIDNDSLDANDSWETIPDYMK